MKKIISVFLALVMVLSFAIVPAVAETSVSVVYYVNGQAVKTVESLTAGSEYTVDFIPSNTNEQYFSGWYYDSEFNNEARTKFTLADGENKLYARMENYKEEINLSTNLEQGDPINVYKWHEIENAWYSDMRWFAGYYRYYNNEVQDILPLLSTLHHIYNSDGSVYSRNFQGWTQSGVFVIVDGEGNAVVPKPSTKYKVTVDFTSNSGNAASMSLQTAWKFSEVDMYSSGNTTFNENRVHQNGNSAHEYGSANFKTTAGVYATDYISTQATTKKQTLTFELTTPSIEAYISNNYYQILGFRLSIPGNDYISFQSIKIENMTDKKCSVEYYNADGSSAGLVENLEIGEIYNPDRMPTKTAENGKTFVGWKTADGKMVNSNGVTLAETGNKLYAVYTDVVTENKTVNLYNSNITNGKLYNAYLYDGVYNGYIPYEHNGGYGPKNEITQGTDAPYTRFTSGQYNGMSATYMFDENAVALQGKWNTTYTITLQYRMPAMDEDNPIIIQPFFGINKAKVDSIDAVNFSDPSTVKRLARANGLKTYWAYNFKGGADEYRFSNNTAINDNANPALQHNIVEPSNEWQTLTFFVETGAENNDYLPLFALYVNVQTNGVQGGYNSNIVDVKDITVTECRVDKKLDTATIAGKEVAYAKIADHVEDKETYKVVLYGAADSWADIAFMTANAESINDNQGFVEGVNKPIVSFGYGSTYIKTVYITIDKFGDGQGDALYLYITGGADKVKSMSVIEIEKLTDKNGGSLIGNIGVSMLSGLKESDTQALRYYFTYDTNTGEDVIIDGTSYAIKSRGFLITNADTNGNSAVTRTVAANSGSTIKDVNISENFTKCWQMKENTDGTKNLWFSTYVTGFKADGGLAYNNSQRLYVKGYIVINVNGNDITLYSKESTMTVKDVVDNIGGNCFTH